MADPLLGCFEALAQHGLVDLGGASFVLVDRTSNAASLDHRDGDVAAAGLATGDDNFEGAFAALFVRWERNPFAVGRVPETHGAYGAVERNVAKHERC